MLALVAGCVTAYLTAWLALPLLSRAAWRMGLLDRPGAGHHVHLEPVPRLGGVAVFFGFLAGVLVAAALSDKAPHAARAFLELDPRSMAMVIAGAMLFAIGLVDDLKDIPPPAKLAAQIVAAAIICSFGFRIDAISLPPGITWHLGWLSLPLTVFWIIGVSNAINLIDGIDGLAAGVSIIALVAISATSVLLGGTTAHWYSLMLVAALAPFLLWNLPPARIFLGDSGSLVVGFLLAILAVKAATRTDGVTYALVPIFALAYPLLDTGFAIGRRWLRRAPLSRADDRHIHHQLRALGIGAGRTVGILCLGASGVAVLGLSTVFLPPAVTVAVAIAGAVVLAVVLLTVPRLLQYYEFLEAGQSFALAVRNSRRHIGDAIHARDLTEVIRAARTLDEVSALLADAAVDLHVAHISVRPIDAVMLDELARTYAPELWRLEYPVCVPVRSTDEGRVRRDPILLTIWCRTDGSDSSAGAERIARILAPAIGEWVATLPPSAIDLTIGAGHTPILSPVVSARVVREKVAV